MDCKEMNIVEV